MAAYGQLLIIVFAGLAIQQLATPSAEGPAAGLDVRDDYTIVGNDKNLMSAITSRNADGTINVVVEIPTGTVAKWKVRKSDGVLMPDIREGGSPRRAVFGLFR